MEPVIPAPGSRALRAAVAAAWFFAALAIPWVALEMRLLLPAHTTQPTLGMLVGMLTATLAAYRSGRLAVLLLAPLFGLAMGYLDLRVVEQLSESPSVSIEVATSFPTMGVLLAWAILVSRPLSWGAGFVAVWSVAGDYAGRRLGTMLIADAVAARPTFDAAEWMVASAASTSLFTSAATWSIRFRASASRSEPTNQSRRAAFVLSLVRYAGAILPVLGAAAWLGGIVWNRVVDPAPEIEAARSSLEVYLPAETTGEASYSLLDKEMVCHQTAWYPVPTLAARARRRFAALGCVLKSDFGYELAGVRCTLDCYDPGRRLGFVVGEPGHTGLGVPPFFSVLDLDRHATPAPAAPDTNTKILAGPMRESSDVILMVPLYLGDWDVHSECVILESLADYFRVWEPDRRRACRRAFADRLLELGLMRIDNQVDGVVATAASVEHGGKGGK